MNSYQGFAQALLQGNCVVRITPLTGQQMGNAHWYLQEQAPEQTEDSLYEVFYKQKTLLICGGGHVSVPVCQLGKMLGYFVIVVDDRPEFAHPERFPQADKVLCQDFSTLSIDWSGDLSVVIVTRGHVADTVCLRQALGHSLTYLGMIGSKKKNQAVFALLKQEGFSQQQIDRVHAPIGLDIGAQTPEEIAVAIAAQWIATRPKQEELPYQMLQVLAQGKKGVMATVVKKKGSAPRDVGARMFFCQDGRQFGTIGGGLAELEVCKRAQQITKPECMVFDMANGQAGQSGMICGGQIEVLFEVVQ